MTTPGGGPAGQPDPLAPFLVRIEAAVAAYGLPLDASLPELSAVLLEQNGKRVRCRWQPDCDAVLKLKRRDGGWQLLNRLQHAERALAPTAAPASMPHPSERGP